MVRDLSCTSGSKWRFPHIAVFRLCRSAFLRQRGGMSPEHLPLRTPEWPPRSMAPVCLLTGIPELRNRVLGIATAAGAELIDELPVGSSVSAIVFGPDFLRKNAQTVAVPERRGCPRILVGMADEPALDLWDLAAFADIGHVVPLPEGAAWLAEFLNGLQSGPELGEVIALIGGCGGAGASTAAALLAVRSVAASFRTLLIDGDPWGPGIANSLAAEPLEGLNWSDLLQSSGTLSPVQFAAALPQISGCSVLGFAAPGERTAAGALPDRLNPAVVSAALDAARRSFELIFVDLGRSAECLELFDLHADQMLCLVTAGVPAMFAARKMLPVLPTRTQLVVRKPFPEGLDAELIAEALGVPLLGEFPHVRGANRLAGQGALAEAANRRGIRALFDGLLSTIARSSR